MVKKEVMANEVSFRIGTNFHLIGLPEYPFYYDSMEEALNSIKRIRQVDKTCTIRLVCIHTFTTEIELMTY